MSTKTIWKFALPQQDDFEIEMPDGSVILHVREQKTYSGIQMCLWAEVDPVAPKVTRRFAIYGTGHDLSHDSQVYLGTLFYDILVFHVYEVIG